MPTTPARVVYRLGAAALAAALVAGCAGRVGDTVAGAEPPGSDAREVTLRSDDSTATVPPVCVEDIPEDLTACAGAPKNLGKVELDETRKLTLQVSTEVSTSGYRLRVNGNPLPGMDGVLNDKSQPFQIPPAAVTAPGPTVVRVEALQSTSHPIAVWQFLVSDPAGPPQ
jgi:hypothetical protein